MPLLDIAGNTGATAFKHSGPMAVNTGVICASIVTFKVAVVAHCPAAGVKVYVVVPVADVLITAGLQVPVIPLADVNGSAGATEFKQSEPNGLKVGVTFGVTVISNVVGVAHWPAVGVNVYVPLAVLLTTAGDQVPVMPLFDVNGSTGATEPSHIAAIGLNVGVTFDVTVTSMFVDIEHCPADGVNVYVPLAVLLTTAGDQVPVMPLVDVNGSTGATSPEQIGATAAKVGVTLGVTVISSVVGIAH
jgi:hypothetical protein